METSSDDKKSPIEKKIATSIGELPPLKEDYIRVIHITDPNNVEGVVKSGLKYEKYGMAMSTARAYGDANEVEYTSTDPRFYGKALVFDMRNDEWKLHNNILKSPGVITPDRLVGIVDIILK